jgi:hypothetical protein
MAYISPSGPLRLLVEYKNKKKTKKSPVAESLWAFPFLITRAFVADANDTRLFGMIFTALMSNMSDRRPKSARLCVRTAWLGGTGTQKVEHHQTASEIFMPNLSHALRA